MPNPRSATAAGTRWTPQGCRWTGPALGPRRWLGGGGGMTRPSNGTEGDAWMHAWCRTCVNDRNEDCPIVLRGLSGEDPPEWHRGPAWSMETIMYCTSYESYPA